MAIASIPRRRLSPAARREEILGVAGRLMSEHGYRGVALETIADDSGITKAGLQHHFASKDILLLAVLRHRDSIELSDSMANGIGAPSRKEFIDNARTSIERSYQQRETVRLFTVLSAEALDETHPAHQYFVDRLALGRTQIPDAAAAWLRDPESAGIDFSSYMDGLQLNWLRDPSIDYRGHANRFVAHLMSDEPETQVAPAA